MSPAFDLLSLRLFVDTVRLGSLSKAAAQQHLSQPSASTRVATLEGQLGLKLLERSPTGSVPTANGGLVVEWAIEVLAAADRMSVGIAAIREQSHHRLRVAASYTIAEYLLPRWLAALRDKMPVGRMQLEVVNSATVIRRVIEGEVDLGFVECPTLPPAVSSQIVARDELVVLLPRDHPWVQSATITHSMLAREPLIVREEGSGTRESFELAICETGTRLPPPALELGSTASVKAAVGDGVGAAVLSDLAVGEEARTGAIVLRRVVGANLHRDLRAVWPSGKSLIPNALRLLEVANTSLEARAWPSAKSDTADGTGDGEQSCPSRRG